MLVRLCSVPISNQIGFVCLGKLHLAYFCDAIMMQVNTVLCRSDENSARVQKNRIFLVTLKSNWIYIIFKTKYKCCGPH